MRAICVEHSKFRCSTCTEIDRLEGELETTKRQLEESLRVIEFYGDEHNWLSHEIFDDDLRDFEDEEFSYGGLRAREFLNKLKNERGE